MLTVCLLFMFFSAFSLVLGFMPLNLDSRPRLKLQPLDFNATQISPKKKVSPLVAAFNIVRKLAIVVKPLCSPAIRQRMSKDLAMGKMDVVVEEFMLIKLATIFLFLFLFSPLFSNKEIAVPIFGMCLALGYLAPDFWLKSRIKNIKEDRCQLNEHEFLDDHIHFPHGQILAHTLTDRGRA